MRGSRHGHAASEAGASRLGTSVVIPDGFVPLVTDFLPTRAGTRVATTKFGRTGLLLKRAFFLAAVPILLGGGLDACSAGTTRIPARSETIPTPRPAPLPPVFGPVTIDAAIRAEWARLGVTPAPRVDDARFLRRAYLDVVGTVPPPSVVRDFLADPAADKRARLVDSLLASPAYAVYWATLWEDSLVGWRTREPDVDRGALREWLEREFAANTPWDALVTGLITATGQNSPGGRRSDGAPAPPDRGDGGALSAASEAPINGAVNWFLKYRDAPQDLAGSASRLSTHGISTHNSPEELDSSDG